jgi:VWFA-related protein
MKGCHDKKILLFVSTTIFCLSLSLGLPQSLPLKLDVALAQSGRKSQGQGQAGQSGQGKSEGQKNQPGQKPDEKPVIRLDTREVVIPLSAYDAEGRYVDDLRPRDVLVIEDNEARVVTSVKREPASIVLVLDLCNEFGTFKNRPSDVFGPPEEDKKFDKDSPLWANPHDGIVARPAPREFADNFVSRLSPKDQISIIQYSDRVELIQDWTNSREEALGALRSKYRIGLSSHYHDALKLAADKLRERTAGRRLIVLLSDGVDSASETSLEESLAAVKRAQATVFVIGWAKTLRDQVSQMLMKVKGEQKPGIEVVGTRRKRIAELSLYLQLLESASVVLRDLAQASGGDLWLPPNHRELTASPKSLVTEIGAQYSLSFLIDPKSSNLDDTRSIQVLPARQGLSVHARTTYYVGDEGRQ